MRSSLHEDFVRVKTPIGLGRFEVRFFSGEKFTKFDLAPKEINKNQSLSKSLRIEKSSENYFQLHIPLNP